MKLLLLPLLLAFSLFGADPDWLYDFDEAKAKAAAEGKGIMMIISRVGCPACEYMEDVVIPDEEVSAYIGAHFVPLHVDVDENPIPPGFRAFGTPTFYFLNADGKKRGRQMVGAAKKAAFMERLKAAVSE